MTQGYKKGASGLKWVNRLTQTPKLPSYRNQSVDLLWKSINCFLCDRNFSV